MILVRESRVSERSALLTRARDRASSLGRTSLDHCRHESEAELAFAGLHQLTPPIARRMDALAGPQRAALDAAFGVGEGLEPDPYRVALAAYDLVCEAAATGPLILIVDDAHWLDRSSLGALTFIARSWRASRWCSWRPFGTVTARRSTRPGCRPWARAPE